VDQRLAVAMRILAAEPTPENVVRAYVELARSGALGDPTEFAHQVADRLEPEQFFVGYEEVYASSQSRQPQVRRILFAHRDFATVQSVIARSAYEELSARSALSAERRLEIEDAIRGANWHTVLRLMEEATRRTLRWSVEGVRNAARWKPGYWTTPGGQ
jgi:hypothetical protein